MSKCLAGLLPLLCLSYAYAEDAEVPVETSTTGIVVFIIACIACAAWFGWYMWKNSKKSEKEKEGEKF